ncbi:MAG: serine/threonine-protein kinase [Acidobacteria bacterium]|nr:serine/threonine-protein kinase [Acidobacteriota bacterium]
MENDQDKKEASSEATTAASPPIADSPGNYLGLLLKDRYLIEKEIGRGAFGVVYLARDRQLLSRPVVIKVLITNNPDQSFSEWFQKKFRQEMEALVRISHPGVVGVLDSGAMPDGKSFLVMQYVEGVSLRSVMSKNGMEFERVARIVRQIGQALTAAHDKGVCHRDLKPENIMLEPLGGGNEQVKLIDFGVARVNNSLVATSAEWTWVAGTLPYMSPEQLRARPTTESDIYSFAAVAYEMLTGKTPFEANSAVDLYEMQRKGEITPPQQLRNDLPNAAQSAILKSLSFNLRDRHSTALDFSEELARGLTGKDLPAITTVAPGNAEPPRETLASQGQSKQTISDNTRVVEKVPAHSKLFISLIAAGLLTATAALIFFLAKNQTTSKIYGGLESSPTPVFSERSFDYWIVVQKYRNGKPYQPPFRLPGEIMFDAGDHVRLHLLVSQPGYFYFINEGPERVEDLPSYVMLFPNPTTNNGTAQLKANQEMQFPERGKGLVFDQQRGTEKLWLVWSAESVQELEAVKSVVNPKQLGKITDPAQTKSVRDFLTRTQTNTQPSIQKEEAKQQTRVTARGPAFVHEIKLLHY